MKALRKTQNAGTNPLQRGRKGIILPALAFIALLIALNYLSSHFFLRVDLTADKRHTLSTVTAQTLNQLEATVYIKTYLGGELPLEFARLRQGVEEILEEYRIKSDYRVHFSHENPHAERNTDRRRAYQQQLAERGVEPISVQEQNRDGSHSEMLVFPGLTLSYMGRTENIGIYTDNITRTSEENINASIAGLEYTITAALHRLIETAKPRVAFLQGHGELEEIRIADWKRSLARDFTVQTVQFPEQIGTLDPFRFIILANPKVPFSEAEKLVLDQYIMQGGQLLLTMSPVTIDIDSLQRGSHTLAFPNDLNLSDLLFRYGVRIAPTLVQDLQCALVPINTALIGQPARFTPMPWAYFPLLSPNENDPLSRNTNLVYSRFPSAVELTGGETGPTKRIFLSTTQNARVLTTPRIVSLQEIQNDPRRELPPLGRIPVGVLLEGKFTSVFRHRPVSTISGGQDFELLPESEPTKIVVIADGTIGANDVARQGNTLRPLPLGFDKYTQQTFGNLELLDNIALYLNGKEDLLELRGRQLTIRRLNPASLRDERTMWQIINLALPSLLLLLIGLTMALTRWWRFGR